MMAAVPASYYDDAQPVARPRPPVQGPAEHAADAAPGEEAGAADGARASDEFLLRQLIERLRAM
ncbi:hypothetical protein SRB5_50720 [Streptomyces sp. RB5]|uniref:Uncharacterized protein n=1 Tax=Streptomyces smaragdinus TaxID=2585196 RepID=A0A7K0CN33_9ACTN|nr:hypothetical protein [Streptomyces smaragdinus]MQY14896.1 hypothetical protein [Streptomyces smaragdinus]